MNSLFSILMFTILLFGSEPKLINETDSFPGVHIQPNIALEKATPYLEEHGTYNWDKEKELRTYILLKEEWYYIMQTNYPAKSLNFYLKPAVMVHTNSGQIKFSEK